MVACGLVVGAAVDPTPDHARVGRLGRPGGARFAPPGRWLAATAAAKACVGTAPPQTPAPLRQTSWPCNQIRTCRQTGRRRPPWAARTRCRACHAPATALPGPPPARETWLSPRRLQTRPSPWSGRECNGKGVRSRARWATARALPSPPAAHRHARRSGHHAAAGGGGGEGNGRLQAGPARDGGDGSGHGRGWTAGCGPERLWRGGRDGVAPHDPSSRALAASV